MEGEAVSEAVGTPVRRVGEAGGAGPELPELSGMPSVLRVVRLQAACEGPHSRRDPLGPGACCHSLRWMPWSAAKRERMLC